MTIRKPYYGRLLICRVAYMKKYEGATSDYMKNGGSYVKENNDGAEKYNFRINPDDGICYGFCEAKYRPGHTAGPVYANTVHIEKLDPNYRNEDIISNVRVVFTALSPISKKECNRRLV